MDSARTGRRLRRSYARRPCEPRRSWSGSAGRRTVIKAAGCPWRPAKYRRPEAHYGNPEGLAGLPAAFNKTEMTNGMPEVPYLRLPYNR
jgi:hypothetical protein